MRQNRLAKPAHRQGVGGGALNALEQSVSKYYTLISVFILLISIILRAINLGETSLWLDEAIYANNALTDFGSMLDNTRAANSSPILLPLLYQALGEGFRDPLLIRLPPALFSVLAVAAVLAMRKAGLPASIAALSGLLLAIAPEQVGYAQEVREYSLSVLASCAVLLTFTAASQRPGPGMFSLFLLALFISPLASYGSAFLALAAAVGFTLIEIDRDRTSPVMAIAPVGMVLIGAGPCPRSNSIIRTGAFSAARAAGAASRRSSKKSRRSMTAAQSTCWRRTST
jgi:uncharacterized membrane protein